MDYTVRIEITPEARSILDTRAGDIKKYFLAYADPAIDPLVFISPGGYFRIMEYERLVALLQEKERTLPSIAPAGVDPSIIMVIVTSKGDITEEVFIRVPDPRFHPERWPWAGPHLTEPPRSESPHPADEALGHYAHEILRKFMEVADEMIDPAILVNVQEGEIYVLEHIQLIAAMQDSEMDEPLPPHEPGLIVAAVLVGPDIYRRRILDPRVWPDKWPWPPLPF